MERLCYTGELHERLIRYGLSSNIRQYCYDNAASELFFKNNLKAAAMRWWRVWPVQINKSACISACL